MMYVTYDYPESVLISIEDWGMDHWATLIYIASRGNSYGGAINNAHMRCDADVHPEFCHTVRQDYLPTKLNDGSLVDKHDDWSCVEEMEFYGLVVFDWDESRTARITLTEKGWEMLERVTDHKKEGNTYDSFVV